MNEKYRVWDLKAKKIGKLLNINLEFKMIKLIDENDNIWLTELNEKSVILMRAVGINDNYKIPIHEGDIVKTKYGRLCVVEWFHGSGIIGWDLKPINSDFKAPDSYDLWVSHNLEIMGNIYENQELLI